MWHKFACHLTLSIVLCFLCSFCIFYMSKYILSRLILSQSIRCSFLHTLPTVRNVIRYTINLFLIVCHLLPLSSHQFIVIVSIYFCDGLKIGSLFLFIYRKFLGRGSNYYMHATTNCLRSLVFPVILNQRIKGITNCVSFKICHAFLVTYSYGSIIFFINNNE